MKIHIFAQVRCWPGQLLSKDYLTLNSSFLPILQMRKWSLRDLPKVFLHSAFETTAYLASGLPALLQAKPGDSQWPRDDFSLSE